MRVLVTGGAGFIGSAVLEYAKQHHPEHEYRALDLSPCQIPGVQVALGSILDSNQASKAVRGCDVVIHLAAMLGVNATDTQPYECLKINIEGTVNLLEACARERVKKFVFSSSSEVYGNQEQQPILETNPVHPLSVYGVSKLAGEEYVKAYATNYSFEWSIVRFFNVYGPRQLPLFVVPIFVENVARDQAPRIYGDGSKVRSFCNVRDIAQGTVKATLKPEAHGQVFNIGNDHGTVTMKDLAEQVIRISGKSLKPVFVPYDEADRRPERDPECRIPDISRARTILGYRPSVSLDEGLMELYRYNAVQTAVAAR